MHENIFTPKLLDQVKKESMPIIRDANNRILMTRATLRPKVQLFSFAPEITFLVCEKLAVSIILGRVFCERSVEAIYLQSKYVVLDEASTIRIMRKTQERAVKDEKSKTKHSQGEGLSLTTRESVTTKGDSSRKTGDPILSKP